MSADNLIQMVIVRGGKTKKKTDGKRKRVVAKVELRDSHPRSSQRLTGGKRPRILQLDRDKINQQGDAKTAARKALKRRGGRLSRELACTVLPVPHLELGDRILVNVDGVNERFTLRRFNIPLNVEGVMDLNWRSRRHRRKK